MGARDARGERPEKDDDDDDAPAEDERRAATTSSAGDAHRRRRARRLFKTTETTTRRSRETIAAAAAAMVESAPPLAGDGFSAGFSAGSETEDDGGFASAGDERVDASAEVSVVASDLADDSFVDARVVADVADDDAPGSPKLEPPSPLAPGSGSRSRAEHLLRVESIAQREARTRAELGEEREAAARTSRSGTRRGAPSRRATRFRHAVGLGLARRTNWTNWTPSF